MDKYKSFCLYFCFFVFSFCYGQKSRLNNFKIVPLGVKGGVDESNLSAYMVAAGGTDKYVCLDAGTIHYGIEQAIRAKIFKSSSARVLRDNIKGYLISHPHLDHVSGLVINSPEDSAKNIYGLPFCLDIIKDKYFSWKNWANFGNEGEKPLLKKYSYTYLAPGKEIGIANTDMYVTAFPLSHSNPYQSTAFLVRSDSSYVLYLGDTGADTTEKADNLRRLWQQAAPLLISKKLKAIFIEVSFPNQQPMNQLFGHLTPSLFIREMRNLADIAGEDAVRNFKVIITHIKPSANNEQQIKKQLRQLNTLGLHLIFPEQGKMMQL